MGYISVLLDTYWLDSKWEVKSLGQEIQKSATNWAYCWVRSTQPWSRYWRSGVGGQQGKVRPGRVRPYFTKATQASEKGQQVKVLTARLTTWIQSPRPQGGRKNRHLKAKLYAHTSYLGQYKICKYIDKQTLGGRWISLHIMLFHSIDSCLNLAALLYCPSPCSPALFISHPESW